MSEKELDSSVNNYIEEKCSLNYVKQLQWDAAVGLQEVDNLKPSKYLEKLLEENVSGNLTIKQVEEELREYYIEKDKKQELNHNELECDFVSTRIVELLNKDNFSMIYFDLDNFKAYNDIYGFLNGDEIIKFTARTIIKNIHMSPNEDKFIGHIGGDDFVAIVGGTECESICQNIVAEFDKGVTKYFTDEDIQRGYLEVPNRKGILEQFPITTISVGVVVVDEGRFHNVLEIGETAAQVKHLAKVTPGSTYVIDRRKK